MLAWSREGTSVSSTRGHHGAVESTPVLDSEGLVDVDACGSTDPVNVTVVLMGRCKISLVGHDVIILKLISNCLRHGPRASAR